MYNHLNLAINFDRYTRRPVTAPTIKEQAYATTIPSVPRAKALSILIANPNTNTEAVINVRDKTQPEYPQPIKVTYAEMFKVFTKYGKSSIRNIVDICWLYPSPNQISKIHGAKTPRTETLGSPKSSRPRVNLLFNRATSRLPTTPTSSRWLTRGSTACNPAAIISRR